MPPIRVKLQQDCIHAIRILYLQISSNEELRVGLPDILRALRNCAIGETLMKRPIRAKRSNLLACVAALRTTSEL